MNIASCKIVQNKNGDDSCGASTAIAPQVQRNMLVDTGFDGLEQTEIDQRHIKMER